MEAGMSDKPHKGSIENWFKQEITGDGGYIIRGRFVDHPLFAGETGHTSLVLSHNEGTGEIETRNSRYTLIGAARA
jgi:hypothetical protein